MKLSALFIVLALFYSHVLNAQVGISDDGYPPDASAGLDIRYTDKGVVFPRLTSTQMSMIGSPVTGLMIFNVDSLELYIFTGNSWVSVSSGITEAALEQFHCGSPIKVNHVDGNVAPVSKTVTYKTVTSISGEISKCWISSNLGSERQALAKNELSEAAAGWYWQFNKKQGFRHDGLARTPVTEWITSINESSDWLSAEDPCSLLLGNGWRIPTSTEWTNVDQAYNWVSNSQSYISTLKLHSAGRLSLSEGSLENRGVTGNYWSGTNHDASNGKNLFMSSSSCIVTNDDKAYGMSLRCISCIKPIAPSAGNHTPSSHQVIWTWSDVAGATGYKWNQTNDYSTATDVGTDTMKTETGLSPCSGYTRYVWSYNICGNSSPAVLSQSTVDCPCGYSFRITHVADTVAPVNIVVNYPTVTNVPGEEAKCWIGINLGAESLPTSLFDTNEAIYGWYWQFNRSQGYKHDGVSRIPNTTWITSISENSDWLPERDPCALELGGDWRLPTQTEWFNVDDVGNWNNCAVAFDSPLRLVRSGRLSFSTGGLLTRDSYGAYWSNLQQASDNESAYQLFFSNSTCYEISINKAFGSSVRCISCMNFIPDSGIHITASSRIIWNWTPVTTAAGYKWNTTDDYGTAEDMEIATSKDETGLVADSTYTRYVWSYNDCGYSGSLTLTASTSSFACGDSLYINHAAGNTAPVSKNTVYGTVSNIPGETSKCWITSNLGADHQADSVDDSTEPSAGWYWQFARKQGFKHDGTTRTPDTQWELNVTITYDWPENEDPCLIELGNGWRIPTKSEWQNVDNTGSWTNWNGPWNSDLKLHAAGYLVSPIGNLMNRGDECWTRSVTVTTEYQAWILRFAVGSSIITSTNHSVGATLRCIRD